MYVRRATGPATSEWTLAHCPGPCACALPVTTASDASGGGDDTAASCISLAEGLKNAHGMTNPGSSARRRAYRFTWSEDQLAKMLTTHSGTPARSK